jgi:acetyl-CoA synthetase
MSFPFHINDLSTYQASYEASLNDPEGFWADIASHFYWRKKWDKVLDWNFDEPEIEWFAGGKLNITENCLDRHLEELGDHPAIIWEPNDPAEQNLILTYNELHHRVVRFAQVLRNNGVTKGDRVCIYMGMVPELAVAVLGCARIGAIHSVIFGGFSARSISDRVLDGHATFLITCDGSYRGHKEIPLKPVVDEAIADIDFIKKVIVLKRTKTPVTMQEGRDVWWADEINKINLDTISIEDAEEMDAEDPLFILYTSGSTGKPKGVVHTIGGYMVWTAYTFENVFQYQPGEVYFCTADIGWVTGHSYTIYGPLSQGATSLMFEGIPTWPDAGRYWEIIDKYQVNLLYTAPTAIRALMGHGTDLISKYRLDSLRVLGSVGEPINAEAWHWYDQYIGKGKCPIVDTWWQTETGGIMISNLAGVTEGKPTFATNPLPGVVPILLDDSGHEITEPRVTGHLCISRPWPGMLRTTWGDHERFRRTYFSMFPGKYYSGDGAFRDENGFYRITGRVDDVLNVSGHRIGTAEVENAINTHPGVVESAVVGYPHDIKGQGIYAYIICAATLSDNDDSRKAVEQTVSQIIGAFARPDKIQFVHDLPKTRSGKIMRRILRKIAEGEPDSVGDITTLLDPKVVQDIIANSL